MFVYLFPRRGVRISHSQDQRFCCLLVHFESKLNLKRMEHCRQLKKGYLQVLTTITRTLDREKTLP